MEPRHACNTLAMFLDHLYVHLHGSLYPMMDYMSCIYNRLSSPMSADASWDSIPILLLVATVLGLWYFSDWYDNIG